MKRRFRYHPVLAASLALFFAAAACGQTVEYIHTDVLGSPVAVTNSSGAVIERTVYEPYGAVVNRPLTDGPGFAGHVTDSVTGLVYMQQRYYDPALGRFLSVDPVTADGVSGSNFNRYWYAANNPYKYRDPDGRFTGIEEAAALVVLGGFVLIGCAIACDETLAAVDHLLTEAGEFVGGLLNEKADAQDEPTTTVDDLKKAGTPGRETKGRTENTDMPGGRGSTDDYDGLGGGEAVEKEGGVKVKTLPTGETAVYRPESETRGSVIEVQTKNDKGDVVKVDKLRYPNGQ